MSSISIKFPIVDDDVRGFFLDSDTTTKESVTSSLLLLLLTEPGKRFYNPDFGVNLWQFIFEQNDGITEENIKTYINGKVSKYIPNVSINDINYEMDEEDENRINIFIRFTYNVDALNEEHEIIISNKI